MGVLHLGRERQFGYLQYFPTLTLSWLTTEVFSEKLANFIANFLNIVFRNTILSIQISISYKYSLRYCWEEWSECRDAQKEV